MVDAKRVEQKLPLLITNTPWITGELDVNEYRVQKFKQRRPDRYLHYRNELLTNLEGLEKEVRAEFEKTSQRKKDKW